MTGYLALAALLVLLSALVLALRRHHSRSGALPSVGDVDRSRIDTELAAIGAHTDGPSGLRRAAGLLAAANEATPWHRAPLAADEVDLVG